MADISKITTPDGTDLYLKDETCRLMIAPIWKINTIYYRGSLVTYEGKLYRCNSDTSYNDRPATSPSYWVEVSISDVSYDTTMIKINTVKDYSTIASYSKGSYCLHGNPKQLYRCKSDTSGPFDLSAWVQCTDLSTEIKGINASLSGKANTSDLATKVSKSGDTMTGDLRFDTASSASSTSDGAGISWKETGYGDKFEIRPAFAGSDNSNYLAIKTATGGAGTDPDTVDKIKIYPSGDINIQGQNFYVQSPTSYVVNKSTTIDLKQSNNGISSGALYPAFLTADSNNYTMSRFESAVSSDGSVSTYMYAHNMNGTDDAGFSGIKVTRKKDKSTIWQVDGQKEFRSAINTTTCSISRHSSAPSNTPIGVITRKGNVCIVRISHQFPNTTQNYYRLYNVSPKPNTSYYGTLFIGSSPTMAYVNTAGEVCFNNTMSVPAGYWVIGQIVYLTDD